MNFGPFEINHTAFLVTPIVLSVIGGVVIAIRSYVDHAAHKPDKKR